MKPADLATGEDRQMIKNLYELITEYEPVLREMIDAGFPFEDHWKNLQDRKLWNRRMAEVFLVDLGTRTASSVSPE